MMQELFNVVVSALGMAISAIGVLLIIQMQHLRAELLDMRECMRTVERALARMEVVVNGHTSAIDRLEKTASQQYERLQRQRYKSD